MIISSVVSGFWVQVKEANLIKTMNLFFGIQGTSLNQSMWVVLGLLKR